MTASNSTIVKPFLFIHNHPILVSTILFNYNIDRFEKKEIFDFFHKKNRLNPISFSLF